MWITIRRLGAVLFSITAWSVYGVALAGWLQTQVPLLGGLRSSLR